MGGVALNIKDENTVWMTYKNMTESIKQKMPDAKIEGVTVQPMFDAKDAVELILGIKKDPVFGTSIMLGMGGTSAELFMDKSLGFPPLNETLALRMIKNLKIFLMDLIRH